MARKEVFRPAQWTTFWKNFGVYERRRKNKLKHYNPKTDFKRLSNIDVSEDATNKVYKGLSKFIKEPLLFNKFSKFFRRDPATTMTWTKTNNNSEAFLRLYNIFRRNDVKYLKKRFGELSLLYELNRKGEGRKYSAIYKGKGSIYKINPSKFSASLNRKDQTAKYKALPIIKVEGGVLIPIKKMKTGSPVFKFVKLKREKKNIVMYISADSNKEINVIKSVLTEWFDSYIDSVQSIGQWNNFSQFLKNGKSTNFILNSITYLQDDFKVSVQPRFGRRTNVAQFQAYKTKISQLTNPEKQTEYIRLFHVPTRVMVNIRILSHETAGILGAIMLKFEDRKLNSTERRQVERDFETDFGLRINEFIDCSDISETDIYKILLRSGTKRKRTFNLRSEPSLEIYRRLVAAGILPIDYPEDSARYCTERSCRVSFQPKWDQMNCSVCGTPLLPGKQIVTGEINDQNLAHFIRNLTAEMGYQSSAFNRILIKKSLPMVSIRSGENQIEILLARKLNDEQHKLLRLRYPHALLITPQEDSDYLRASGHTKEVHEIVQILDRREKQNIDALLQKITLQAADQIRKLANEAAARLKDQKEYIEKNALSKNLGAEIFEADCSLLLKYIFGNSIWLGTRSRGKSLPDGIAAFPITSKCQGCFLWDTKFSDKKVAVIGKKSKNLDYVNTAKRDTIVRANGGVKGFVFISNAEPPKSFATSFRKLFKRKKIKVLFMKSNQLLALFEHFQQNQDLIRSNDRARDVFIQMLENLLFSAKKKRQRVVTLKDEDLTSILNDTNDAYKLLAKTLLPMSV